jgi:hypothetical protein
MAFRYKRLSLVEDRRRGASFDSSSTLDGLENIADAQKLEPEDLPSTTSTRWSWRIANSSWLWLIHAVLLLASLTLFSLAVTVRSSTLKHVRGFSAWCESSVRLIRRAGTWRLTWIPQKHPPITRSSIMHRNTISRRKATGSSVLGPRWTRHGARSPTTVSPLCPASRGHPDS